MVSTIFRGGNMATKNREVTVKEKTPEAMAMIFNTAVTGEKLKQTTKAKKQEPIITLI